MTSLLAALLVMAFAFGQAVQFSLFSPQIKFNFLDIYIILFILSVTVLKSGKILSNIFQYRILTLSLLAFSGISLLSLIVSGSAYGPPAQIVGFFYWLRWLAYSGLFLFLPLIFSRRLISRLALILGLAVTATGLYQYLFFPDLRALEAFGWDPHYFRVVGTFLDPGFTGLILVFFLIFLTFGNFSVRSFFFWLLAYLTLALTYSRSGFLALLAGAGYLSWRKKTLKPFLATLVLLLVTLVLLPRPGGEGVRLERTSSVTARILNWRNSLIIFSDHPVLGVGFNTYRWAQNQYGFLEPGSWQTSHAGAGADSSLLFVAATTGIAGLAAYLWYLRSLWQLPSLRYYLVPLLVHSLFLNSLFYPHILLWLAMLTACNLPESPSGWNSPPGRRLQSEAKSRPPPAST